MWKGRVKLVEEGGMESLTFLGQFKETPQMEFIWSISLFFNVYKYLHNKGEWYYGYM